MLATMGQVLVQNSGYGMRERREGGEGRARENERENNGRGRVEKDTLLIEKQDPNWSSQSGMDVQSN